MSSKQHVLNSSEDEAGHSAARRRPPGPLALELQKTMLRLKGQFMSEDGHEVHYHQLRSSQLFQDYESVARQLCDCVLTDLEENERKVFFISILKIMRMWQNFTKLRSQTIGTQ